MYNKIFTISHLGIADLVDQGKPATASVRLFTRNADLKFVSFSKYKIFLKLISQDEKHENQWDISVLT